MNNAENKSYGFFLNLLMLARAIYLFRAFSNKLVMQYHNFAKNTR